MQIKRQTSLLLLAISVLMPSMHGDNDWHDAYSFIENNNTYNQSYSSMLYKIMPKSYTDWLALWGIINVGFMLHEQGFFKNPFAAPEPVVSEATVPKITFDDIIGAEDAKNALMDILTMLKHPEVYARLGAKLPRGVLLEGPPGNGKTVLAKALAGQAGVNFIAINGAEFSATYTGIGIQRVKDLFNKARQNAPCIIFIDEIDGIGKRGSTDANSGTKESERIIIELLTQMDGLSTESERPVIVIGATNHRELIDPALIRPGRIDTIVRVGNPLENDRKEIIRYYVKKITAGSDIDFDLLAQNSEGFSGAELEGLVNQATLIAARRRAESVDQKDFVRALTHIHDAKFNSLIKKIPKDPIKIKLPEADLQRL